MSRTASLYTMCPDAAAAQRTVHALLSAGARIEDITVISSEPFDRYEFGQREESTLMPCLVVLGAILGGIVGFLLVSLTTKSYPIVTGGMPITPGWITGIITYELTMLAAILTTLLVLLLTAPLFRWKQDPYDARVADGKVLVGINPQGNLPDKVKEVLKVREDEAGHEPES
jgi:ActD protein